MDNGSIDSNMHRELDLLPLLPLKNVVLLPKSIIPIIVGRQTSIDAVEHALKHDKSIFVTAQKRPDTEHPSGEDVFSYGTRSTILQVMRMPNRALKILVEGICRARIIKTVSVESFIGVVHEDVLTVGVGTGKEKDFEAVWRHIKELYSQYAQLNERVPNDLIQTIRSSEDIDYIADTIAVHLNLSFDDRQAILEQAHLKKRLHRLAYLLQREIDILKTEQRIQQQVQKQVEKNQREYYLTEQIKAINKELGREDHLAEVNELREQAKKVGFSPEAQERFDRELRKLEQMQPFSAEAVVSRNYIDWLLAIPWRKTSKDALSLVQAEKVLNTSHSGLKQPKERILEFIAAKKFSKSLKKAPIICFVGPPGVGKTSLASAIARSVGREFVRISLGGVKDEAEIRGHRRTYIGAMPGKIIQALRKTKTVNPVMLLDEVDKLSHDFTGDPSAALLEVLDADQNHTFVDHYLDVEYDLSKIMFIATANVFENIPYPLLDRMEIITLSGYTVEEKLEIAQNFLLPKKLAEHALTKVQFKLPASIITLLINDYTKEAGVRQLERVIAKLMRKAIQELLKNSHKTLTVTEDLVVQWLGQTKYKPTLLEGTVQPIGLARGLAWTEFGGDVLEIETTFFPGKGNLTLTGQMGEVMQESAQAALSYVRSQASALGIKKSMFSANDIHVHIPEGATPKDGPSAGITIACALISSLTRTPIRSGVAMTGEITLRGRVLPVGGLKEKILAARRYGLKTVIVPKENASDVQEELKDIDHGVDLKFVSTLDEVMPHVLTTNPMQPKMKLSLFTTK